MKGKWCKGRGIQRNILEEVKCVGKDRQTGNFESNLRSDCVQEVTRIVRQKRVQRLS